MASLVTRFHLLLLAVTIAITGVGFFRIPADFAYPAHWSGSYADWLWPRDIALPVAPLVEVLILAAFFLLGRLLTKNHFAKVQHILDPALTLLLAVVTAIQLGLLVIGIGSDIDLVRLTGAGLGIALLIPGIVFFEAERHTYAGLRMPRPIASDRASETGAPDCRPRLRSGRSRAVGTSSVRSRPWPAGYRLCRRADPAAGHRGRRDVAVPPSLITHQDCRNSPLPKKNFLLA
ncbi:hypothetical protein N8D56_19115 [Devosia sp. A8/3-2]|nr:hypothetical protein N8D56_19115 [Devosia sp. A8/3-2]